MVQLLRDVEKVAKTDKTVLILGETGIGKELVARTVHATSRRSRKPFIKVNCAVIPATLIESEFYGHEKGASTGASSKREGRFAIADGGTIFMDEIGELSVDLQVKLLRILQEGEFELLGSSQTRKVDVRIIAATNRDLKKEAQDHRFRQDFYYRLAVFPLKIPPLKERGEDIIFPKLSGPTLHMINHVRMKPGRS
jgi:transcriptional regulator with GAF, ATPase, and Fis domain